MCWVRFKKKLWIDVVWFWFTIKATCVADLTERIEKKTKTIKIDYSFISSAQFLFEYGRSCIVFFVVYERKWFRKWKHSHRHLAVGLEIVEKTIRTLQDQSSQRRLPCASWESLDHLWDNYGHSFLIFQATLWFCRSTHWKNATVRYFFYHLCLQVFRIFSWELKKRLRHFEEFLFYVCIVMQNTLQF